MKKNFLSVIVSFFFFLPLHAVSLSLEHANSPASIAWGLMGRSHLPKNHGMAFTFPELSYIGVWMFNCHFDISVAFLSDQKVIQEIFDLRAYPEMMDPLRPVETLEDMKLYPDNDPIRVFFEKNGIRSKYPARYMIEVAKGWFQENQINVGDRFIWENDSSQAEITSNLNFKA